MHIQLNEDNKKRVLKAAGELDRSANDVVNLLLEILDRVDVKQHITVKIAKLPEAATPEKNTTVTMRRRRVVRFHLK